MRKIDGKAREKLPCNSAITSKLIMRALPYGAKVTNCVQKQTEYRAELDKSHLNIMENFISSWVLALTCERLWFLLVKVMVMHGL